jgi:equilibrative nucleoside transporter 1/2/3
MAPSRPFGGRHQDHEYEPLNTTVDADDAALESSVTLDHDGEIPFSWIEYTIFGFLGMAMLWAWYAPHPRRVILRSPSLC